MAKKPRRIGSRIRGAKSTSIAHANARKKFPQPIEQIPNDSSNKPISMQMDQDRAKKAREENLETSKQVSQDLAITDVGSPQGSYYRDEDGELCFGVPPKEKQIPRLGSTGKTPVKTHYAPRIFSQISNVPDRVSSKGNKVHTPRNLNKELCKSSWLPCPICGVVINPTMMKKHLRKYHRFELIGNDYKFSTTEERAAPVFICKICSQELSLNQIGMHKHIRTRVKNYLVPNIPGTSDIEKISNPEPRKIDNSTSEEICPECGLTFLPGKLRWHLSVIHPICPYCKKRFSPKEISDHIKMVHLPHS
jgi:hypothetical protein